jgi:hypothetical protein
MKIAQERPQDIFSDRGEPQTFTNHSEPQR